jgi:protein Tex
LLPQIRFFLSDAENPLDQSGIHPESYPIVRLMAADLNTRMESIIFNAPQIKQIRFSKYVNEQVGIHTLTDMGKNTINFKIIHWFEKHSQ